MFLGPSRCKTAICSHCHTVMYPGGSENHKKGYFANGACQVKMKGEDDIPDWVQPEPQGIYVKWTDFHPVEFLKTLWEMYERFAVHGERSYRNTRLLGMCFRGGQPSLRTVACQCSSG